jgi:hypothetical protein
VFTKLDEVVSSVWNNPLPGYRNDWQEIEGCWVLRPPVGQPIHAVVHFIGGSFVGAAPQLCYRLFLEALALRNIMVRALRLTTEQHSVHSNERSEPCQQQCAASTPSVWLCDNYASALQQHACPVPCAPSSTCALCHACHACHHDTSTQRQGYAPTQQVYDCR